jgi:hypothetical protein
VRPLIVADRLLAAMPETVLTVWAPVRALTVYEDMGAPPLLAGAVHDTAATASPAAADTPVGGPGVVRGVTDADGADAWLSPMSFVALTVKVYDVPLVSPLTVAEVASASAAAVAAPGLAVTV